METIKLKKQITIAVSIYIIFMVYFIGVFLPEFTERVGGNEMVDAYLVDYSKSIWDIETLIWNYGEDGRAFMVYFFVVDSIYVVISVTLFFFLIKAVSTNKYLPYIPILAGLFDTVENIVVLYTGLSLNMTWIGVARFFATAKGISLLATIIIIIVGGGRIVWKRGEH